MSDLVQDVRFAVRTFAKNPVFAVVVVLTMALGIGSNTAIFGLMDQVLLRPLRVRQPERLVILDAPGPFSGSTHNYSETLTPLSHPMFEALRDRNRVFSGLLAHHTTPIHFTAGDQTDDVNGDLVSGTYFDVLGVTPAAGRLFTAHDDLAPAGHPVVVLSHGFWMRRFGGDTEIEGTGVLVNGQPMTVVGVAEPGFHGIEVGWSVDVFVPLMMQAQVIPTWTRGLGDWRVRWLTVMARLRDGVTIDEARAGVNVLYRQLLQEDLAHLETRSESFRTRFAAKKLELLPGARGTSELRSQSAKPLTVLMAMVGLVLLIACANVANLLLVRASSRRKEIALRLALGAGRSRIYRQLLVESVMLSLAGGALGMIFAIWTGDFLLKALPYAQASRVFSAEPDLRVGLFALTLSLVTGLVFGSVPSLQAIHPELAGTLKSQAGSLSGGSTSNRFRKSLVVCEVALSLLLLIGASLFVRNLIHLRSVDLGFETERLLAFSVDPALNGYELERRYAVLAQIQQAIAAEPGVRSVSLSSISLMTNSDWSSTVSVEGYEAKEDENMNPNMNSVGPGFFSTLGIPLVAGRDFTDADRLDAPKVAVVNEAFVRYFFGARDPLGRHFGFGRGPQDVEIIGVVRNAKAASIRDEPRRFVYLPYTQTTSLGEMTVYVRSVVDPESLARRMRQAVHRVEPTLPVTNLKTMSAQIGESLFVERIVAALSVAFGGLATLLAAVGLYGLMSYAVELRTKEIGIRAALGAERRSLVLLVLKEVAWLVLVGVAIGLPCSYAFGRLVESQLYGLSVRDPLSTAAATFTLLLVALLAGYLPATRATRVDPVVALRDE